jgi:superfamily II DNA/RNA helicase
VPQNDLDNSSTNDKEESPLNFGELGVPGPLVRLLAADGKTTAFPIQADTLPDSLAGRDLLGRGRTGSGKTLAFAIPLVTRLGEEDSLGQSAMNEFRRETADRNQDRSNGRTGRGRRTPAPRGLVLAPTRELANQINDVLMPLAHIYGMETTTIYGGVKQGRQVHDLESGADIVVACPGRLEDLLRQRLLTLESIEVVVIDEADEMADMGFLPPVKRLLEQIEPNAQHMMFSATLDHGVDEVVNKFLHDPKVHSVDSATSAVDLMTHHVFETTRADKHELVRALASGEGRRILFTRTKFQAKKLAKNLTQDGIPAAELHGNLNQNQRDRNLNAFESGDVRVMVATDVAARGIDVSDVELVVQVEPPEDPKSFLHRSGRTARAGHAGDVVTLMLPEQRRETRRLLNLAGIKVKPIAVTHDSPEVVELVGSKAELVNGWSLEQSQPAGRQRRGNGDEDGRGRGRKRNRGGRNGGSFNRGGRRDSQDERRDYRSERGGESDRDSYAKRGDRSERGDRGDTGRRSNGARNRHSDYDRRQYGDAPARSHDSSRGGYDRSDSRGASQSGGSRRNSSGQSGRDFSYGDRQYDGRNRSSSSRGAQRNDDTNRSHRSGEGNRRHYSKGSQAPFRSR